MIIQTEWNNIETNTPSDDPLQQPTFTSTLWTTYKKFWIEWLQMTKNLI